MTRVTPPLDCTIIGDILLDVTANVNNIQHRIIRGGTTYVSVAKIAFGGSGNVAAGLSMLGGKAAFVGKAGNNAIGKLYVLDLKESGVISKVFFDKHSPTGLVITYVEDMKERSFLVSRGANDRLSTHEIEKVKDLIRNSKYIYFSGFSLVGNPQRSAILRAVNLARKFKTKVVFDPGAHNLIKSQRILFSDLLTLCDVFSPNLNEAMTITNTTNVEETINELRKRVPLTALKCGENGSIIITKKKVVRSRGLKVKCEDPTGAGDAFTAALIYGLSHDLPSRSVGRLANWFAAQVTKNMGSRSFPPKSKINTFLEKVM